MKNLNFFINDESGKPIAETVFPNDLETFLKLVKKYGCKILNTKESPAEVTYELPRPTS